MKYLRKEHFTSNHKPLTYEALLQTNGGYAGSSGGGSGYSSSSGSSCGKNSKNNTTTRFIRNDKYSKTYGTKNTDNTETVTTIDIKTGKINSRYTYGISKGSSSKGSSYAISSSGRTLLTAIAHPAQEADTTVHTKLLLAVTQFHMSKQVPA